MEYLYRDLNKFDMELDPLKNGLVSKRIIEEKLQYLFYICFYHTKRIEDIFNGYENVPNNVYNSIYNDIKYSFIKEAIPFITSDLNDRKQYINSIVHGINQKDTFLNSYNALYKIASTLQTHLLTGSRKDTDWISFSKNLASIKKFYLEQKKT